MYNASARESDVGTYKEYTTGMTLLGVLQEF